MKIRIIGRKDCPAYNRAQAIVEARGHEIVSDHDTAHLAIAPLLTYKLTAGQINEPQLGTLIFHPSPLPYGRGCASIKWAFERGEPITAATWLWADEGLDTGDICEMEIVKIDHAKRPRDFYEEDILPALGRTLERALDGCERGLPRRIPQVEKYASFDKSPKTT